MRAASLVAIVATAALPLVCAGPSMAGDNNAVYIKQESPAASMAGNALTIDQSAASNSLVIGPNVPSMLRFLNIDLQSGLQGAPRPASQRGEGNQATITMKGDGGVLQLLQDTSPFQAMQQAGSGTSNSATVSMTGAALGAVVQLGTRNRADLELNEANGLVAQFGADLTAELSVDGRGSSGQIVQIGNRSNAAVDILGSGTNVTYTQVGNDLVQSQGVEVFTTNSGNISITQTGF